jgi:hypothetical protein
VCGGRRRAADVHRPAAPHQQAALPAAAGRGGTAAVHAGSHARARGRPGVAAAHQGVQHRGRRAHGTGGARARHARQPCACAGARPQVRLWGQRWWRDLLGSGCVCAQRPQERPCVHAHKSQGHALLWPPARCCGRRVLYICGQLCKHGAASIEAAAHRNPGNRNCSECLELCVRCGGCGSL